MRGAGYVARKGKEECMQNFVGKPEGKRTVGRIRRRWMDNIKMDLRKIGLGDMD
jgi:hypothetical protein